MKAERAIPDVDLDAETVLLEGAWLDRAALVERIQGMIAAGDYRIARPSAALERLEATVASARVVAARVPAELAEALEAEAARRGVAPAALVREAVERLLGARS